MASVVVTGVNLLENPAMFHEPFKFEITFECLTPLQDDIEWTLTYVGSPDTTRDDQQLDSVLIGPVAVGLNRFVFEAAAPDIHKLPKHEWIGTTVVLLQCAYRDQIFFRVGYFVMNEYTGGELIEHPDSIAARRERHRKLETKILNALNNGEGWNDFEDFVREQQRESAGEERKDEEEEEDDEDGEEDEESAENDEMIVEDDEESNEESQEADGDEDEEDEEDSDEEEGAPGGKRPPAGKQPPAHIPHVPEPAKQENENAAPDAKETKGAKSPPSAEVNAKKRPREELERGNSGSAANNNVSSGDGEESGRGDEDQALDSEQEPSAKKRKLSEYPQELIDDYIQSHLEDGPRWYINVNPLLIQRRVLMDDPRVTLFTINWGDDDM